MTDPLYISILYKYVLLLFPLNVESPTIRDSYVFILSSNGGSLGVLLDQDTIFRQDYFHKRNIFLKFSRKDNKKEQQLIFSGKFTIFLTTYRQTS